MAINEAAQRAASLVFESELPDTAKDLVRLLGWDRARCLIHELGGVAFPVPRGPDNNRAGAARYERLCEIVGEDGADLIVREYRDDFLRVPNCKIALAKAKRRAMIAFYDAGATLEETAIAFGVTTRWVSMSLKRVREVGGSALRFDP